MGRGCRATLGFVTNPLDATAMDARSIAMAIPDEPLSSRQGYRCTAKAADARPEEAGMTTTSSGAEKSVVAGLAT